MSSEVPTGWDGNNWTIQELSALVSDKELGTTRRGVGEKNISLIKMGNLQDGKVSTKSVEFLEYADDIECLTLQSGDFLFNTRNTPELVGKVATFLGKERAVFDNNILRLRFFDFIDSIYMGYFFNLSSSRRNLKKIVSGTTSVAAIYWNDLKTFIVPTPPLPEQKKIASILTSVDEVIENTQKQIDKLQDLKKATMNELLTKGIGHTEFKDTELGRIPKSWDVRTIGELGNIITGSTPSTTNRELYDGDYMFVSPADISEGMFVSKTGKKLSLAGLKKTRQIPNKSIMVVCIGSTIGKVALTTQECASNQQINSIVPKENDPYFIYFAMKWMAHIIKKEAGTQAVPLLNKTGFSNLIFPVPPTDEQQKIGLALHSINVGIESLMSKLSQTQSLKKSLMQDLLTGKVRVTVN